MSIAKRVLLATLLVVVASLLAGYGPTYAAAPLPPNPQSGAYGIEGTIPGNPPTRAATITVPANGQTFTATPINVSGICQTGLLVKIFKNNVFGGAANCTSGSYSLQVDLFSGRNDLVARVYDALDQAGPNSNTVRVTFNDTKAGIGPRITLISNYAKRGADPGQTLDWPLNISGGTPPYALSVDWGDQKAADLFTRQAPGDFTVDHIYDKAGIYNVIIKATDANGVAAFLQLVGVGNGPVGQSTDAGQAIAASLQPKKVVLWWPLLVLVGLSVVAFWLGKKHQLQIIRDRLHRGERPFND